MKIKIHPVKPSLIMLYGYPGSGKTTFAKNLSEEIKYAHLDVDRLLGETAKSNRLSYKEAAAMMTYLANEFIKAGVGVILDFDMPKAADRHRIKMFAKKYKLKHIIVWLQIDVETAQHRATSRDKRKSGDKFSKIYSKESFRAFVNTMQNPTDDDTIVISGKHNFNSQKPIIIKKLLQKGVIKSEELGSRMVKPELMSLVPKPTLSGDTQTERRNISIN
jgi:predicted kinase